MIFGSIRNMAIALALGLAIGGVWSGILVKRHVNNSWEAKIDKQKVEAAAELQSATDRAIKAERSNNSIATELEVQNEINKQKLDDSYRTNRALSTQLGGLRDPGRRPSGDCTASTATGAPKHPDGETTGAALSTEASDFLLDFAKSADSAAQYATTCYNWLKQLKEAKRVE